MPIYVYTCTKCQYKRQTEEQTGEIRGKICVPCDWPMSKSNALTFIQLVNNRRIAVTDDKNK